MDTSPYSSLGREMQAVESLVNRAIHPELAVTFRRQVIRAEFSEALVRLQQQAPIVHPVGGEQVNQGRLRAAQGQLLFNGALDVRRLRQVGLGHGVDVGA